GFTRRNHVAEKVIECLGMFAHGIGEGRTAFNVLPYLQQNFLEDLVFCLGSKDLDALHQRQAGINHDRKLPREDRELFLGDASTKDWKCNFFPLFFDLCDDDLLASESSADRFFVFSDEHAALNFVAASAFPFK